MENPWHHHIWPRVTLQSQIQGHSDFEALYLVKEQSFKGHMLLLNINRKAYMEESPMIYYIWPWVTLKCQIQGHSDFEALYFINKQS